MPKEIIDNSGLCKKCGKRPKRKMSPKSAADSGYTHYSKCQTCIDAKETDRDNDSYHKWRDSH